MAEENASGPLRAPTLLRRRGRTRRPFQEVGRVRERESRGRKVGTAGYYLDLRPYGRVFTVDGVPFRTREAAEAVLARIREDATRLGNMQAAIARATGRFEAPQPVQAGEQLPWQEDYRKRMWASAKRRAQETGRAFNITIEDVVIPDFCPVLGLKLEPTPRGAGVRDCAPSIDRIDSRRGYERGNVTVISWRANRMKRDFTAADLRKLCDWLEYLEEYPEVVDGDTLA